MCVGRIFSPTVVPDKRDFLKPKEKEGVYSILVVSPPCRLACMKRHPNEAGPAAYLKIQDGYRKMIMRMAQNIVDDLSFLLNKLTSYCIWIIAAKLSVFS